MEKNISSRFNGTHQDLLLHFGLIKVAVALTHLRSKKNNVVRVVLNDVINNP